MAEKRSDWRLAEEWAAKQRKGWLSKETGGKVNG
jgi:hypothetical protein